MLKRILPLSLALAGCAVLSITARAEPPAATPLAKPSIVFKVTSANDRLEMTVHTSKILTMDQKIPQAQVNNPDILELTPLSPNQVQISAKAAGVTQINLWGEDKKLFTIDVIVFGDVRELEMLLRTTFPTSALKVTPVSNSVMISGFVDQQEHIDRILRIAEEYYPKVINNMTVSGVQQVLLHVKVMEVSRTKLAPPRVRLQLCERSELRDLGHFWSAADGAGHVEDAWGGHGQRRAEHVFLRRRQWQQRVLRLLDALRQDNLLKILSDPTLVTISGRPASFNSGGEIPIPVPQSLGTISIEWKQYGTQVDFVPIVSGQRQDPTSKSGHGSVSSTIRGASRCNGTTVPGIKSRNVDTGVEMMAGQTLAIAGLVQKRKGGRDTRAALDQRSALPGGRLFQET